MTHTTEQRLATAIEQSPKATMRQISQAARVPLSAVLHYLKGQGFNQARLG